MVGTEKGPSFYDYRTGQYTNYRGSAITGTNKPVELVQCGMVDKKGIVWMGSNRLGLMRYDPRNRSFKAYSRLSTPYPLYEDGMTDLLLLPDERIFLIGYGRPGIFDGKTTFFTSYRNDSADVFKLNGVSTTCYDANQHIWLANPSGKLYEYDPVEKGLTDQSALVASYAPLSIYKIVWHGEDLFIGSNKGMIRVRKNAGSKLFSLNLLNTGSSEIRGLLPQGNYIWFSNSRVIGRLNPGSGKMLLLGEKEGLTNVQLFSRTLTLSPQGTVMIGSNRGYYEIFPDRISKSDSSSAAYLTGFRVYDKPLLSDEVISDIKKINLRHNQNFFAFDISAFNYSEAEDMEYAYMLVEFDKDWQYIGNKRSGSYTNVPGGDFVLKIKARNASGEWNENGQSVIIHIGKPLSATWWFRLLLLTVVAAIIYIVYRFRIKQINKEARLRSDYEIKLNELENSALRTQMNPHFIFNSLNTINSFINNNDRTQANQYISKFSRLVRLILDHSRQKKISLKDELEVAELYIQLEQIRFQDRFHFEFTVKDIDPQITEVPPLIIQPFVENAILHGLLPSPREGKLQVSLQKNGEVLYCFIEDNGIGREAARKIKESSGYQRQSHGMEITMKRIELFNKDNGLTETVRIVDLKDQEDKPAGTRVEIPLAFIESF
jgi:two-component sensor histidine kinase